MLQMHPADIFHLPKDCQEALFVAFLWQLKPLLPPGQTRYPCNNWIVFKLMKQNLKKKLKKKGIIYIDKALLITSIRPASYWHRSISRFISSSITDCIAPREKKKRLKV